MSEHPIEQVISAIDIDTIPEVQGSYAVGRNGVTRIEACEKSGMYSSIPYLRVWRGDHCLAEFCQHNIVGVYFEKSADERQSDRESAKANGIMHIVDGQCTTCGFPESQCECVPF